MWYVIPVDRKWVEIREAKERPKKVSSQFTVGHCTVYFNTYKGGVTKAVIPATYFKAKTGRSAAVLKQIPKKEALIFVD